MFGVLSLYKAIVVEKIWLVLHTVTNILQNPAFVLVLYSLFLMSSHVFGESD